MISRRLFLRGLLAMAAGGVLGGGYAAAEPFRLNVTRYRISPPGWPRGLPLRLAVLADLHVCEPWMGLSRLRQVVRRTNALNPDAVLLLGDYVASVGMSRWSRRVSGQAGIAHHVWAAELGLLKAPLGIHAVLGNHDWWEDKAAQARGDGPTLAGSALATAGVRVYENDAVRLTKGNNALWLAGLGDQWAFIVPRSERKRIGAHYRGRHDLAGTMAALGGDDAPVILMAHEPDIFPQVPERVALTVCGHTHGGQVRPFGFAPIVPSRYGRRYDYGQVVEGGRHLVVSGGLGVSGLPIRFGIPPEIVALDLDAPSV